MSLTPKLLILLLLVLSNHVESGSIIKFLPGFEGPLPFELETGYIGVGDDENAQFFYYFVKSERNPKEDPLLMWLNGGPGCAAFGAIVTENGPMTFKGDIYNGSGAPSLVSTTYSWSKVANLIYLDQPVGSGFSYSKTPIPMTSDTDEVKRSYDFIQKWLSEHPSFYSNPLYVVGDSYSGMIVPALVQSISKGNYICCKPLINLQGYILGNPITHEVEQNFRIPFTHGHALISDELYESMKRVCKGKYIDVDPLNSECLKLNEKYLKCIENISVRNILTTDCDESSHDCYYYSHSLMEKWANDESVREALHVEKGTIPEWKRCNRTIPYDMNFKNSIPYHKNNSISGYPSLIYSGDHDIEVPFLATQDWIRSLNYSVVDDWRPWMIKDQVAGYTRTYSNKMTFATVKGGGHTAMQRRDETSMMFQRWISGQPL